MYFEPLPSTRLTRRILILTAGFGDGHNAAARNLAAALADHPDAVSDDNGRPEVVVRDLFAESAPRLNRWFRFGYRMAITFAPRLWQALYDLAATRPFEELSGPTLAPVRRCLEKTLDEMQPDAVVSTYPAYPPLIEARTRRLPPTERARAPFSAVVVTDAVTIHPVWVFGRADRFYVADKMTAGILESRFGVDPASIAATGFPVSPSMPGVLAARRVADAPDDAGDGALRRILFFPSRSRRDVARELASLRRELGARLRLTILLGRHARRLGGTVAAAVRDWPGAHPPDIREWVTDAWALMPEHDLVIAKAGGATVHEAVAAQCPMLIDKIVPGQEEGNARLVATLPCGWVAETPGEFDRIVRHLAGARATGDLARFREVLAGIDAASAASRTARDLLAQLTDRRLSHHRSPPRPSRA